MGCGDYYGRGTTGWLRHESENILQRQLDGAVTALARDHAERSAGRVRACAAPVGVIENIEHFEAELQVLLFGDRKILAQAHVPIPEARISQQIALLHTESSIRRLRERIFVEPDG